MKRLDACALSDMLEQEYGQEFNVPYLIMQDQKLMQIEICDLQADQATLDEFNIKGDEIDHIDMVFEMLIDDLCYRKKIEAGEYLLSFDD